MSKDYGADQQRLQISDLHFDKFTPPKTFASWKIRFKTEVSTCPQFPTEAMLWIREVEIVDDLKSSRSIRGIPGPNFELLDARLASALNRIIHNTQFKRRISLEEQRAQKEDRFFRGRQIAYLIYEYFRVAGAHDTVLDYADLFSMPLRNDNVQDFGSAAHHGARRQVVLQEVDNVMDAFRRLDRPIAEQVIAVPKISCSSCPSRVRFFVSRRWCDNWRKCGNTAQQCRLGLFQDSDSAGDLEDSESTSGGLLCVFGSHSFVPVSWMCKKQTSVSHSSERS